MVRSIVHTRPMATESTMSRIRDAIESFTVSIFQDRYGLYANVLIKGNGESLLTTLHPDVKPNDPKIRQLKYQLAHQPVPKGEKC